jgi:hypothetical protein
VGVWGGEVRGGEVRDPGLVGPLGWALQSFTHLQEHLSLACFEANPRYVGVSHIPFPWPDKDLSWAPVCMPSNKRWQGRG